MIGCTKKSRLTARIAGAAALMGVALLSLLAGSRAATKPTPMKVGETVSMTLERDTSQDYVVSLGKGSYRLVWDAERVDGTISNIIGKIQLLKPNGVIVDSRLLSFNETSVNGRIGMIYRSPKPFVARLRVFNGSGAARMWLSVVPIAKTARVPFGWGASVTPARIASENGVGGTLEPNAVLFHSVTLPKGKWSISLGLKAPGEERTNLIAHVAMLDAQGMTLDGRLILMNETELQARAEGIVTMTKPTPILLRVANRTENKAYAYDITIDKAE